MDGDYYLTVGELKKSLEGVPDDFPVYYERIDDSYFSEHGWKTREMQFDLNCTSEYIRAWASYRQSDEDAFVINGNY